jgi:citrate synthase
MSPTNDSLTVIDNRNGKKYVIPISTTTHDTAVAASAFKDIVHQRTNGEKQGLRITDRGFLNTAVIQSSITFIDGDKGILRYRGYPIEQLAANSNFLESAYLLIWGELPTKSQYSTFHSEVMNHSTMHIDAEEIFRSFRYGEPKQRAWALLDEDFCYRRPPHVCFDEHLCCTR